MSAVATSNAFMEQVIARTPDGYRLRHCLQCGSCGGSCPSGEEMDHSPRQIFAMIEAGEKEKVLSSNTMWFCVSCYFCVARCPQKIPITDIMYTLKQMAIAEGYAKNTDAPAFAKTFTGYVDRNGRNFEFGMATKFYLTNRPFAMLKMGPMGIGMLLRGRMAFRPTKIRQMDQLKAIINKAKELGGSS